MQTHILCLDVAHPFASVCSRNLLFTAFVPFLLVVVLFVAALWPANAKRALPEWTHGFAEFITPEDIAELDAEEEHEARISAQDPILAPLLAGAPSSQVNDPSIPASANASAKGNGTNGSGDSDERTPLLKKHANTVAAAGTRGSGGQVRPPLHVTSGLFGVAFAQVLGWCAVLAYAVSRAFEHDGEGWYWLVPAMVVFTWIYAASRPIIRPQATPPYDLLALYFTHFLAAVISLHATISSVSHGATLDTFGKSALALQCLNAVLCVVGFVIIGQMPLQVYDRNPQVDRYGYLPALEDYCSLWSWMVFTWVDPLIKTGSKRTLEDADLWQLSKLSRSKLLLRKFSQVKGKSLLARIWKANLHDLALDLGLTACSAVLSYASPFFLKRILDAIEQSSAREGASASASPVFISASVFDFSSKASSGGGSEADATSKETAYLFAFFAFVCTVLKSQADLQHLYYGRRAGVRIKGELISSIYDKALRKKDISGLVNHEASSGAKPETGGETGLNPAAKGGVSPSSAASKGKQSGTADNAKPKDDKEAELATADVGKIVSLMAGDAQRTAQMVTSLYMIYSAPIELVIASVFLFNLMGWSAFAGFATLIVAAPIQHFLTRRNIFLSRSLMAARDKRMGVMNELIQSIKFIKYFAWERGWSKRVLDARERELSWLIKRQINMAAVQALWTLSPAMVTVLSFACYVLVEKKDLTISVAFTAIALFTMLRGPLNVIPMMINELLSAYVSVQRIEKYLEEDEVPEWVSTLKTGTLNPSELFDERLGCEDATFHWHSAPTSAGPSEPKKPSLFRRIVDKVKGRKTNDQQSLPRTHVTPAPARGLDATHDESGDEDDEEGDERTPFEMRNLNVVMPKGKITLVCGPTGSGKSSFLSALLGEMGCVSGRVYLPKAPARVDSETGLTYGVSYCAQQPWLEHQTIRENILFGNAYEPTRYEQVLSCCALKPDLAILEGGDLTEIGERGVSLSGGQKARVALARAVYNRSATVLLDDVLAAVDSHTAQTLVKKCLNGPLMKGRTVVLVTHHVDLVLPSTSWVVKLVSGEVAAQGTPSELRASEDLADIIQEENVEAKKEEEEQEVEQAVEGETQPGAAGDDKPALRLVEQESKASGSVKWEIYHMYLSASGYWLMGAVLVLLLAYKSTDISEKFWLSFWGQSYQRPEEKARMYIDSGSPVSAHFEHNFHPSLSVFLPSSNTNANSTLRAQANSLLPPAYENVLPYLGIYALIQLMSSLIWVVLAILGYIGSVRAARILFRKMLHSVIRTTSRFLDRTPSGRILNRFARDIETLDTSLQGNLRQITSYMISLIGSVGVIAYAIPPFAVPAVFLAWLHWKVASGYIRTGRDLRRMESTTRSPIFSSFGELLVGIMTVRAFGAERRFRNGLFQRLDRTQSAWHLFWMTNRWLLFRFDVLGATSVLLASVFSLMGSIPAGLAGIAITQAQAYVSSMYWLCRFFTALEMDLNSVERVHEYLDLPAEAPAVIEDHRPPAYWPSSTGGISVQKLVLKYSPELEPVLHGVSFDIKPREKIGLVGRTGSGKSTMALAFFRFVEYEEGRIIIDGLDISQMGLDDLRSRLTIIPQDAVLFSGTIRENLDPFHEHTDEECLDALHRVQLRTTPIPSQSWSRMNSRAASRAASRPASVRHLEPGQGQEPGENGNDTETAEAEADATAAAAEAAAEHAKSYVTLESKVSDGGGNFSQGQRQLLAMARALLRGNKVIIMDEATASVDFHTDHLIQETIREEFKDSILVTIAHRLRTVMDYDRILVLDAGRVAEFDTPAKLIEKEGVFHSMCAKSGEFNELRRVAFAAEERRKAGLE